MAAASPTPALTLGSSFNATAGGALQTAGLSIGSFVASLGSGLAIFGIELALFLLLNGKFTRIYIPRTFLVPERERISAPPKGIYQWILPVFKTSDDDFIRKCGLDAYFFLRYLKTLLKIFIPMALVILPILLPINFVGGRGSSSANGNSTGVNGLDLFAWGNVRPEKSNRYWAHLVLAVGVVVYTGFVFFDELRHYITKRQEYLTTPQHRLRASATTVLVTAIPPSICTFEALNELYDVFPGGIRNIWVNRNFDALNDKVKQRNKAASALESAETSLVRNAKKAHLKRLKEIAKNAGKQGSISKEDDKHKTANAQGIATAQMDGISSGDPHQVRHTLEKALGESEGDYSKTLAEDRKKPLVSIPVLGQGLDAFGRGIGVLGKTVYGGIKNVGKEVDERIDERINTTGGLVTTTNGLTDPQQDSTGNRVTFSLDGGGSRPVSRDSDHHHDARDANSGGRRLSLQRQSSGDSTVRQSAPQDERLYRPSQSSSERQGLGIEGAPIDSRTHGELPDPNVSTNSKPTEKAKERRGLHVWNRTKTKSYGAGSRIPHGQDEDQFPLSRPSPMTPGCNPQATINGPHFPEDSKKSSKRLTSTKAERESNKAEVYPTAYSEDCNRDARDALWKTYLKEKDRETMRLPIFGWQWMISLPLLGKKVDKISHCRKKLARLNIEIEQDQKEPEKFPLMNSAFVQFNHQVAAHMACQSLSHHVPNQMAPRVVEISPDDVIWDNMSIRWWESYIRTGAVIVIIVGLIIGWAFPVSLTGFLSQLKTLAHTYRWLAWLRPVPNWAFSLVQGILPQALLGLILLLLPVILRFLAKIQGNYTGMAVELSVQQYYFAFLFVQVFLVVSLSSGITTVIGQISRSPRSVPSILAQNLPRASNYFFSYLLLQALSTSAGALVQVMNLFKWFVLAPLLDSTARQKWRRQTKLPDMQWGTFFPVYTNFACIGLIYSVISPLILVFNIITFSLFWLVYRYNTLYVTKFRFDTGGLLYPTAVNQLFTGLYLMELCLIGLFFLVEGVDPKTQTPIVAVCRVQAIIMIVVLVLTGIFQWLLNMAFAPLFRYLPISLEDKAVERDEEFARAQEKNWQLQETEQEVEDLNVTRSRHERYSEDENGTVEDIEMQNFDAGKERGRLDPRNLATMVPERLGNLVPNTASWADRSRNRNRKSQGDAAQNGSIASPRDYRSKRHHQQTPDVEAQRSGTNAIGEALFSGINDEIEDLTPDERDTLVQRAFQHEALRARRPVIWIPRDDLGVSDDEIHRTREFSENIWISNEYTGLDDKARVVYRRPPPDFSEVDLIEL